MYVCMFVEKRKGGVGQEGFCVQVRVRNNMLGRERRGRGVGGGGFFLKRGMRERDC